MNRFALFTGSLLAACSTNAPLALPADGKAVSQITIDDEHETCIEQPLGHVVDGTSHIDCSVTDVLPDGTRITRVTANTMTRASASIA